MHGFPPWPAARGTSCSEDQGAARRPIFPTTLQGVTARAKGSRTETGIAIQSRSTFSVETRWRHSQHQTRNRCRLRVLYERNSLGSHNRIDKTVGNHSHGFPHATDTDAAHFAFGLFAEQPEPLGGYIAHPSVCEFPRSAGSRAAGLSAASARSSAPAHAAALQALSACAVRRR